METCELRDGAGDGYRYPDWYAGELYEAYARLRRERPVHFDEDWGMFFLSRYGDCREVLTDRRFGREASRVPRGTEAEARQSSSDPSPPDPIRPLVEMQRRWMLLRDPPAHGRLKRVVQPGLSGAAVARGRRFVEDAANDLLGALPRSGEIDLSRSFAVPLSLAAILHALGLPRRDGPRLREWSRDLSGTGLGAPPSAFESAARAAAEISTYCETVLRSPGASGTELLAALAAASAGGGPMTEQEAVSNLALLLFGGHETTAAAIGNGLDALRRNPGAAERLRDSPQLIGPAVDEILRLEPPIQVAVRAAFEDVEIGGRRIGRGDWVALLLGAANRDPDAFPDPDSLDLGRTTGRHLALGSGPHVCPGRHLGRLVAEVAIGTLLRTRPDLLGGTCVARRRPGLTWRIFEELVVGLP